MSDIDDIFESRQGKPVIPIPPTALRGPADADHYRELVGRFRERWYTDPLDGCDIAPVISEDRAVWPSISHIKKASSGDWSFVTRKRIAKALDLDEAKSLAAMSVEGRKDRLASIDRQDLNRASARGTNVHLYFERGLRGQTIEVTDEGELGHEYLPAVQQFFDAYEPTLLAAEVVCIDRDLHDVGYGGTSDGVIEVNLPPAVAKRLGKTRGTAWVDWKSRDKDSNHGAYAEEAAQLGGYAAAQYMIVEGPLGPQRQHVLEADFGIIVSVKPDGCRVYPIDLVKAREHFVNLHRWWCDKRTEKASVGRSWQPLRPEYERLVQALTTVDEMMALAKRASQAGYWTPDLQAVFAARRREIEGQVAA